MREIAIEQQGAARTQALFVGANPPPESEARTLFRGEPTPIFPAGSFSRARFSMNTTPSPIVRPSAIWAETVTDRSRLKCG